MLLMALLNEHLLTFNQYKDAKTLFTSIQTRFGGNNATRKTQKTLLKQINIHEDDLEEMDLKWKLALLSMKTRKFFQKTGRKITINGSDTAGYDMSRNQDSSRRTINVEDISSKAMLAIDGAGFDSSFMTDEEVPTIMDLMDFSDSESQIPDKSRKGLGFVSYNVVSPPITILFSPPNLDLSNSGLEEFQQPEFEGYGPKTSKSVSEDTSNEVRESLDASLVDPYGANCNYHQRERMVSGNNYTRVNYNYSAKKAHPSEQPALTLQNMYSVDMINIVPKESLIYLVAKATLDESMLWHRKLGHINFKTINKLFKDNLVRVLPVKRFENDQTCVACLKGKQRKASCKSKIQNSITQPLFMLHMDLFGPTFDETSDILKNFITKIENVVDKKVKIIRCDNGTEFKNRVMNEFCEKKGIKREFSIARTPQQNGITKKRNRTLIEAARTMLADSKLPTTFWAEAVNTTCYVQNRVIIVKPHNKTPYELFRGRTPSLSFMRPFGCHVTILNTLDHLDKFDGKSDDGFFIGYSLTSKAFRVYNIRMRKVEENLHIMFLENKHIVTGDVPKWLFDIDSLTKSMNYVLVVASTNSNDFAGSKESNDVGHTSKETEFSQDYIVMPLWKDCLIFDSSSKNSSDDEPQPSSNAKKKDDESLSKASGFSDQEQPESSTPNINTVGPSINIVSANFKTGCLNINSVSPTVITTRSNRSQNISDMFSLGRSVDPNPRSIP
ncbi:putative ribonuclease H-like domain-containing protein [Tanacetum coccineum]